MENTNKEQFLSVSFLNCLKLNKNLLLSSLLVIMIGIFLLPNIASSGEITEERIIELTNRERKKAEVISLSRNEQLTQAALNKGRDILNKQVFEHNINNKKFSSWISEVGYDYSYTGENLAVDFITSEGIINAWLLSNEHKKNLLNPNYKEVGVAILEGNFQGQNTILVIQIFGTRLISIIPDEILQRDERIGPARGEVLSANEYFEKASRLKEKSYLEQTFSIFGEKKSTLIVEIIIFIFSLLFALLLTYFYLFALIYLVKTISKNTMKFK